MAWTLAAVGVATLVAGLAFARVGAALRSRVLEGTADERALHAFATWWLALGGSTVCVGGMALVASAPQPWVAAVVALRAVSLILLSVAMWGLLSHVVYLWTGRSVQRPVGVAYAALTAFVLAHLAWSKPTMLAITSWTVEVAGEREGLALTTGVLVLAYLVPPIAAGVAYVRLAARVEDTAQRRRLRLVGGGIATWILAHLLARASDAAAWQFTTRVAVGLLVAALFWSLYVGRRPAAGDDALAERIAQLV